MDDPTPWREYRITPTGEPFTAADADFLLTWGITPFMEAVAPDDDDWELSFTPDC